MKTRFKGHETFFFREGWLSKAMFELYSNNNHDLFVGNNGIVKLGVGANMVKSIKYWMQTSNLLQYNNKTYELTDLGKIIAANDVYLEDIFSLWILHINIVRNEEKATTWNIFFNQLNAKSFTLSDVKTVLKNYLEQNEIKFAESSLDADINVLLNMYSKKGNFSDPEENFSCPLERLNLIKLNRNIYTKEIPDLEDIHELVVLYAILLLSNDKNQRYVSISDVENGKNSLTNIFNFNRIIINEYLEQLASLSYIRIEKTAGLDMVYVTTDLTADDVVKLYFERRGNL